jgi:two-component system response regulator
MTKMAPLTSKRILLVEDSPGACELLVQALSDQGLRDTIRVEQSVAAAWECLRGGMDVLPSLILLDLKLRNSNGLSLLRRLRADARLSAIPVVILTTSDEPQDIAMSYAAGANGYVVKPGEFKELVALTGDLCRYWLGWNRVTTLEASAQC